MSAEQLTQESACTAIGYSETRWRRTAAGRNYRKAMQARYRKRHPDKILARHAVRKAIRQGVLLRASVRRCVGCGGKAAEYHHHKGYDPANHLNVLPVCKPCHNAI